MSNNFKTGDMGKSSGQRSQIQKVAIPELRTFTSFSCPWLPKIGQQVRREVYLSAEYNCELTTGCHRHLTFSECLKYSFCPGCFLSVKVKEYFFNSAKNIKNFPLFFYVQRSYFYSEGICQCCRSSQRPSPNQSSSMFARFSADMSARFHLKENQISFICHIIQ